MQRGTFEAVMQRDRWLYGVHICIYLCNNPKVCRTRRSKAAGVFFVLYCRTCLSRSGTPASTVQSGIPPHANPPHVATPPSQEVAGLRFLTHTYVILGTCVCRDICAGVSCPPACFCFLSLSTINIALPPQASFRFQSSP